MNAQEPHARNGKRRVRRIWHLKKDDEIYAALAKYQFVSVGILEALIDRQHRALNSRLQGLWESGYLNRERRDLSSPYVYFMSPKGSEEAMRLGLLTEPRYLYKKSKLFITHDLQISLIHLALDKAFGHRISFWEQWEDKVSDRVQTADGRKHLTPDAVFVLDGKCYFLENVRNWVMDFEKLDLYDNYRSACKDKYGYSDFRLLTIFPTQLRIRNFLNAIMEKYPYRRFWFTDLESVLKRPDKAIWWTPADFSEKTYSLA